MADPTTINKLLSVPLRGTDVGTWDVPVNGDFTAIDGMLGGVLAITSTGGSITLTTPSGTISPGAGPTQAQNALLRFSGTLGSNLTITCPMPGLYVVENLCVVGSFGVVFGGSGGTLYVSCPPGQQVQVFCDGTNVKFANLPPVGSFLDLCVSTVPTWITQSSPPPYLNCDGTAFATATYPQLFTYLGTSTLPDSRGRFRAYLNQGTGRISTTSGFGLDGNTLMAVGGTATISQGQLPPANFSFVATNSYTPFSTGGLKFIIGTSIDNFTPNAGQTGSGLDTGTATTVLAPATYTATGFATSNGSSLPVVPPSFIGGLTLIRAG